MASEIEIRSQLQAVADGHLDLWDFADWIDSYSWNMHRDSMPGAIQLSAKVHHRFAEYDIHGDESVLRRELDGLLNNILVAQPIEVTEEQQRYFAYIKMASLVPEWAQASSPVAT